MAYTCTYLYYYFFGEGVEECSRSAHESVYLRTDIAAKMTNWYSHLRGREELHKGGSICGKNKGKVQSRETGTCRLGNRRS